MQYLRLTGRPDPETAPAAFRALAASPHVAETRLLAWNPADSRGVTALFAVEGDPDVLAGELADAPAVAAAETAPAGDGRAYLLATLRAGADPLLRTMLDTLTRDGLVVAAPVVYRGGAVHALLVGQSGAVGAAVERVPPVVDVEVRAVGERGFAHAWVPSLSGRQREAVLAALDLGYYDRPRGATHADVAARLGCAPSTASEHLQKAEAKLVRSAMGAE